MRLFVFTLKPITLIAAGTLLAALAVAAFFLQPAHGGEGGWCRDYTAAAVPERAVSASAQTEGNRGKLAIIIDDFGEGRDGVSQMMLVPCRLTFAVMPFGTYSKRDAEDGFARGYEIIVHLPMEPMHGKASWLGSNPILCSQDDDKIGLITQMALFDVPHAVGANIHMGSKASADRRVMQCILGEVKKSNLFFVDSKTGSDSVVMEVADNLGVPCAQRNVFLDGQRPQSYIESQLRLAGKLAAKNGMAIAIGHVGVEGGMPTARAIRAMLPELDAMGVDVVFVSELMPQGD